jgi:SAM-dependent methyltransferase
MGYAKSGGADLTSASGLTIPGFLENTSTTPVQSVLEVIRVTRHSDNMRHDWDERARQDAFKYIASWREDWDEASFFESGEQDYLRFVDPFLQRIQFAPATKSMVEFGSGVGRMTRSFAGRFGSVFAVDISREMQERAKKLLTSYLNIHWILSSGESSLSIEDNSVDFVFSYLVLQHIPDKAVLFSSIAEMLRVLRPGGVFLFQFNGSDRPTMNWKGRAISGILDNFSSVGLKTFSKFVARSFGIDPGMIGKTWRGATLSTKEIAQAVTSALGNPEGFLDPNTPFTWCYGSKSLTSSG